MLDDLDPAVAAAFDCCARNVASRPARSSSKCRCRRSIVRPITFAPAASPARKRIRSTKRRLDRFDEYDPRVGKRIALGRDLSAADYVEFGRLRDRFIREVESIAAPFDAMLMPTVPCVAPTIAEATATDDDYFRWNGRILRNVGLINFLDGCAVSLPCHPPETAPVGLSVCGVAMSDRHTLAVAAAIEAALSKHE